MSIQAFEYVGSGWRLIHPEFPADNATWTDALQSPTKLTVTLGNERPDAPRLLQWKHGLGVVIDGTLRAFGIVTDQDSADQQLTINCMGLTGYPNGMPWMGRTKRLYNQDAGHMINLIWDHLQTQRWGNLGVQVDRITSGVTVGRKTAEQQDPSGKNVVAQAVDEPFLLDSSETHDLGAEIDRLATEARLEWREIVSWERGQPHTRMHIARRIGRRRHDLHCEIGLTVIEVPTVEEAPEDYASDVLLIGAGEGPTRVAARATVPTPSRIRRVHVHQAQDIYRMPAAVREADRLLSLLQPTQGTIKTLALIDHPSLPVWSIQPGDELRLIGDTGQAGRIDRWMRVIAIESSLTETHRRTVEVEVL